MKILTQLIVGISLLLLIMRPAHACTAYGTLSNFDTVNDTQIQPV